MNALWFQQVQVDVWYAKTGLRHFIPADSFSLVDSVSDDILSSAAGEYFFDARRFPSSSGFADLAPLDAKRAVAVDSIFDS